MRQYLSDLASTLQGLAYRMADAAPTQIDCPANLKRAIDQASRALEAQSVRVVCPPTGRPEVIDARGQRRKLTRRERLAIWLLRGRTEIRP